MNPNQVRQQQETGMAIRKQAHEIDERLNRQGIVSPERRMKARENGYSGPLTRAELARRIS